ncbi:hypothetical protein AB6A40_003972 [Gnathostoma spinigerum]|uniref:L-dopachrome isomerase n=1 Tax=Gnathostoma spinigerum TaxID=75299 RepID=A0ABD6EJW7_9BILA
MPVVTIITNVARSKFPSTFNSSLTKLLSEIIGKPQARIFVLLQPDAILTHGGETVPTCVINFKSIGAIDEEKNRLYSSKVSDFMKQTAGIAPEDCFIHFTDLSPENVGLNGSTVKAAMAK